jgi:hypothetical protein
MRDRFILPLLALAALGMIALALVWPQGLGRPSPAPFGKPVAPLGKTAPKAAPTLAAPAGH